MNTSKFEITNSGQLVKVTESRSLVVNADQMFGILKNKVNEPASEEAAAATEGDLSTFYNLGDGVCAFQRDNGHSTSTFGGVMLHKLPVYTDWTLTEEEGKHVLIPNRGNEDEVPIGAPLIYDLPEDLIVHFFVKWVHEKPINVINPNADIVWRLPKLLGSTDYLADCYLTAFSRSRNTCVRLPLPNLYDDAHLCTGSSFRNADFDNPMNHWGLTTSVKTFARNWSNSKFNLDLLGGPDSRLMKQYRRFIRFDVDTVKAMPFSGCEDWGLSTSPAPLEEIYKPWISNERPTMPKIKPGEENLPDTGEEITPVDTAAFEG